jgi:hypothetical protein
MAHKRYGEVVLCVLAIDDRPMILQRHSTSADAVRWGGKIWRTHDAIPTVNWQGRMWLEEVGFPATRQS